MVKVNTLLIYNVLLNGKVLLAKASDKEEK
jgi:hypothetical protein